MAFTIDQFSRRQSLDLRLSMAAALAEFLRAQRFPTPVGPTAFAEVFDEWPTADDRYVTPAACILPRGSMRYADARLTPTLIENTWEPRGFQGFGLYALADAECDFEAQVRCPTVKERSDIVSGFETLFVEDSALMNHPQGRRYGRLIAMPTYYNMQARFSLQDMTVLDDADSAMKNRREVVFVIRAQAKQVKVDRVSPFVLQIREVIDDEPV